MILERCIILSILDVQKDGLDTTIGSITYRPPDGDINTMPHQRRFRFTSPRVMEKANRHRMSGARADLTVVNAEIWDVWACWDTVKITIQESVYAERDGV